MVFYKAREKNTCVSHDILEKEKNTCVSHDILEEEKIPVFHMIFLKKKKQVLGTLLINCLFILPHYDLPKEKNILTFFLSKTNVFLFISGHFQVPSCYVILYQILKHCKRIQKFHTSIHIQHPWVGFGQNKIFLRVAYMQVDKTFFLTKLYRTRIWLITKFNIITFSVTVGTKN